MNNRKGGLKMSKIAVVYWSGTGNTEQMANAVVQGITEAGGEAVLLSCSEFTANDVDSYDAFAFGCPSMGAEQLEESEFDPMFSSVEGSLAGRKAGLFGSWGWGNGVWMEEWQSRCESEGILIEGTVTCCEAPDAEAEEACRNLGKALV